MGQINIPMSNKNGTSSFWKSMWDNKHEYTQNLHDCFGFTMLLRAALHKFFIFQTQFALGMRQYFFDDKNTELLDDIFKNAARQNLLVIDDEEFFMNEQYMFVAQTFRAGLINETLKVLPFFSTTSWILKFKTWIVVFVNLYLPKSHKSRFDFVLNKLTNQEIEGKKLIKNRILKNKRIASINQFRDMQKKFLKKSLSFNFRNKFLFFY